MGIYRTHLINNGGCKWLLQCRLQPPNGYSYTQFKLHVSKYRESHDYAYHNDYESGEQMQIDFAGDVLDLTDLKTGKSQKLVVLACVMLYSNLPFMMAMPKATTSTVFLTSMWSKFSPLK